MITIVDALVVLKPNAEYATHGDAITWLDSVQTQPTDEEIQTEIARLTYLESINQYQRDRQYPPMNEQLDNIFHNGVDAWKADIQVIKDAVPKVLPDSADQALAISTHVNSWRFAQQVEAYKTAKARVAQYQLSVGVPESSVIVVTGEAWNEEAGEMRDVTETVVIPAIEALVATVEVTTQEIGEEPVTTTVANPVITKDIEERAAAQVIIDATPQPVKDHVDE
tara:strand:- start:19 stop:690 length:672 start_codon:yes stop_codon:yes gene_type:complete